MLKDLKQPKQTTYHRATECVHVEAATRDPHAASSAPVYLTATFRQASASGSGEYDYSRSGNPTRSHLESHLAKLMRASRAFALSSGMTALDVLTRLVRSGEEIVAGRDLYGGTNRLLSFLQSSMGITVHHIDTTNQADTCTLSKVLNDKTRLVLLESPTNPLIKICDIPRICELVKERAPNALVVVDNTMVRLLCKCII